MNLWEVLSALKPQANPQTHSSVRAGNNSQALVHLFTPHELRKLWNCLFNVGHSFAADPANLHNCFHAHKSAQLFLVRARKHLDVKVWATSLLDGIARVIMTRLKPLTERDAQSHTTQSLPEDCSKSFLLTETISSVILGAKSINWKFTFGPLYQCQKWKCQPSS